MWLSFRDDIMPVKPRVAKVLAALLASMTLGAIALMALGNNPPSAGPFCLASYYKLDTVEKVLETAARQYPQRWDSVQIYYSGTKAGNLEQIASLNGLSSPDEVNCHFFVCNGLGGEDGEIIPTKKWQKQWSVIPTSTWYGRTATIRICVIGDGQAAPPKDCQIRRVQELVRLLCRKFHIKQSSIHNPENWRL